MNKENRLTLFIVCKNLHGKDGNDCGKLNRYAK
jgi:hypothetical protein